MAKFMHPFSYCKSGNCCYQIFWVQKCLQDKCLCTYIYESWIMEFNMLCCIATMYTEIFIWATVLRRQTRAMEHNKKCAVAVIIGHCSNNNLIYKF